MPREVTVPNARPEANLLGNSNPEARLLSYSWKGPHADPFTVQAFEKIQPGLGVKLVEQGLKQSDHRMWMEKYHLQSSSHRSWGGLIAGFLISMSFLSGSIFLITHGYPGWGEGLGGGTIAAIVAIFITGQNSQRSEREQKSNLMPRLVDLFKRPEAPKESGSEADPEIAE